MILLLVIKSTNKKKIFIQNLKCCQPPSLSLGWLGGAAGIIVGSPLDVLKVNKPTCFIRLSHTKQTGKATGT